MSATERVINDLNVAKLALCNPQTLTPEMCVRIGQAINSAIDLLTEQEPSKIVMSTFDEEWYGSTLECTTCGCRWMMSDDDDTCCCPHCGRKVKWE